MGTKGNHLRENFAHAIEILGVARSVRQSDIYRTALLTKWEVMFAMHGTRKYIVIGLEDTRRAIALMYVQIDDRGAPRQPLPPQHQNGDGEIVEDTETRALRAKGVVCSARQIAAHTCPHCVTRSCQRAADTGE